MAACAGVIKSIYKIQINCRQWAAHVDISLSDAAALNVSKSLSPLAGLFARKVSYCEVSQSSLAATVAATATHVLIYFRWFVVIFGWHRWHFLCRAFININDVRRFCSLPAKYVCIFGQQESCLSLIISLLNRGKRWRKLCQFVGLSLVSLEHALCVYSQMWHSQWPKGYTRWRDGKEGGRTRSTGNCQLPIKKPSALASRQLICM